MEHWKTADVEACIAPMRRYARVLTGDPVLADELVQDALLRAYERASSFRPGAQVKPWLLAILHNVHVSQRRRQAVETRAIERLAQQSEGGDDPLRAEQAIALQEVARRYQSLPEAQRAVLHLVVVEELSYREVADALDIPIGTVMSRLSRARTALRQPAPFSATHSAIRLIGGNDAP